MWLAKEVCTQSHLEKLLSFKNNAPRAFRRTKEVDQLLRRREGPDICSQLGGIQFGYVGGPREESDGRLAGAFQGDIQPAELPKDPYVPLLQQEGYL